MSHIPEWDDSTAPIRGFYCTWTDKDLYLHGERMSLRAVEEITDEAKGSPKQSD